MRPTNGSFFEPYQTPGIRSTPVLSVTKLSDL